MSIFSSFNILVWDIHINTHTICIHTQCTQVQNAYMYIKVSCFMLSNNRYEFEESGPVKEFIHSLNEMCWVRTSYVCFKT